MAFPWTEAIKNADMKGATDLDNNKKFELEDDVLDSVTGGVDQGEPRNDGLINTGTKCKSCRTFSVLQCWTKLETPRSSSALIA